MKISVKPRVTGILLSLGFVGAVVLSVPSCGGHAGEEAQDTHKEDDSHEGEVHLDTKQLMAAGIETIAAAPGAIEKTLHLVARVAGNEDTVVHVSSPVGGIVQTIHKGLGEKVNAGDALVELWSVELGNTISGYLKARATVIASEETLAKSEELFRKRMDTVATVLDGEIAVARKIYERESDLQEQGIATVRPFLEADKELQKAVLGKDREITTLTAERDTQLLALDVAVRQARIEQAAAKDRLLVLGFDEKEIESFQHGQGRHGRMTLRAPRDGVVVERHVTLNEYIDTTDTLLVINDLSTVWVLASAYEKDLTKLRLGQKAHVRLDALQGADVAGEVSMIDFRISSSTRSAAVRVDLANQRIESWPVEFPLRPGMFGEVEIVIDSWSGRVVLPEAALVHDGEQSFVFVAQKGEDGSFLRKPVKVRRGARELVEIVEGVDPGEAVVVKGSFTLESVVRSGQLGEGHSH